MNKTTHDMNILQRTKGLKRTLLLAGLALAAAMPAAAQTPHATGVDDGVVYLNDLEDHSWAYYNDPDCPIRSLSPADVTITYYGNGQKANNVSDGTEGTGDPTNFNSLATGVQVNVGSTETEHTFVYYKTLERAAETQTAVDWTATTKTGAKYRCAYTTIPNPFQKRPTAGSRNMYIYSTATNWTTRTYTVTYTDASGNTATTTLNSSNTSRTITVRVGTNISVKRTTGNNSQNITMRYDNNSGTQFFSGNVNNTTQTTDAVPVDYRGFWRWRVKSVTGGSIYATSTSTTALADTNTESADNVTLEAEKEYYFAPNAETGMAVELEALWARAYVTEANNTAGTNVGNYDVGYERNFYVLTGNNTYYFYPSAMGYNGYYAIGANSNYPVTISRYYPDGNAGSTTSTVRVYSTYSISLPSDTKFENVAFSDMDNRSLTANGHDLVVGRGCSGTVNTVYGIASSNVSTAISYTIRLESGTFNNFYLTSNGGGTFANSTASFKAFFGCDYDRANKENENLTIAANGNIYGGNNINKFSNATNRNNLTYDWVIKSGSIQQNADFKENALYLGNRGNTGNNIVAYMGRRRLTIEGGLIGSISGGLGEYGSNYSNYTVNDGGWTVQIKMKGENAIVKGAIWGAAVYAGASGDRQFVFTKGQINGWIAGGCNGTQSSGGELYGNTEIYFGGKASVGDENGGTHVGDVITGQGTNGADGGHIFGAGCGILPTNGNFENNTVGKVDNSTVVIADDATVWRDVHGGGNYGWVRANGKSSIYVNGGIVKGNIFGGSNNQVGQEVLIDIVGDGTVEGGVYGGSHSWGAINDNVTINIDGGHQNGGVYGGGWGTNANACGVSGTVTINMTGGNVLTGIYGGSNVNGNISGNVTMQINGGQVGTSTQSANIHGGGYGSATRVLGSVELNVGSGCNATSGVTVYGDIYGGSAEGRTNGNTSRTTGAETTVNLYKGIIYGGLYGGGLGTNTTPAYVYGPVQVNVFGGSVLTNDGTGENGSGGVFGCNNVNGSPQGTVSVDIYGTDPAPDANSYALYAVYGGGNRSNYTGTPVVTIHGCNNSIEYVYGGGNASDVRGTDVTIWGGHIGNAFGGGNGFGASNPGANITADGTNLTIHGGQIEAAFGGSNQKGYINSTITVTVAEQDETGSDPCGRAYTSCDKLIVELYGGGNEAPIKTSSDVYITPDVTINSCDMEINNLFGGAKAADYVGDINLEVTKGRFQNVFGGNNKGGTITGNVTLTLKGGTMENAFGGCNESGDITGKITVEVIDAEDPACPLHVDNVYGGGKDAAYSPDDATATTPEVNILHGTVHNAVFGGGLGETAKVKANTQVTIGDADDASHQAVVGGTRSDDTPGDGNVYGGGSQADVIKNGANTGNTHVILTDNAEVMGNVYGGGNQADVGGQTKVELK